MGELGRVVLTTPRLTLREFVDDDVHADLLVALNADPRVTQWVGEGPVTRAEARAILRDRICAQHRSHGVGRWATFRTADDAFVGWAGFKWHADDGHYDLGYRFLVPCWGQGYGTEVARACMAWADEHLRGERIVGVARVENTASLRILEAVGGVVEREEEDCGGVVRVLTIR